MQLNLGQKIRELRRRDGRTQEALAEALGVTSQAISRWEANGGYPDMEIVPSIANYFGITIDELFGYKNDRENKIDTIIKTVEGFHIKRDENDDWIDECIPILREGLDEFPQNDRLLVTLAETLWEAGWRRHREWLYYDEEGFIQYDYDKHKKNAFWSESMKICERLANHSTDKTIVAKAISLLVPLYRNYGECLICKAVSFNTDSIQLSKYISSSPPISNGGVKRCGSYSLKAVLHFEYAHYIINSGNCQYIHRDAEKSIYTAEKKARKMRNFILRSVIQTCRRSVMVKLAR